MRYYYLLRYYRWSSAPGTSVGSPRGSGGGADGTGAGGVLDVRESLFVHCVTDMVVKNKEWVSVLGKYDAEGRKEVCRNMHHRIEHPEVLGWVPGHFDHCAVTRGRRILISHLRYRL